MENTTQPQQITVNDLDSLRTIVDVAVRRGAFNAKEAAEVGVIYNKLDAFLTAVAEQSAAQSESAAGDLQTESTDSQGE